MKLAAKIVRRTLIPVVVAGGIACASAVGASAAVVPVACYADGTVLYYDTESGAYALFQQ
ncbi:hypothetical protein G1H11_07860 [Phytoactinopolyspora alkaliphila]|uniref:Uncharacterized protein n=1 Tax=Phytoactinopolyspora alkaliphila TaxID=1783498 RepID=A0A6N9YK20_9ACTN|nr:hypothetical protein [Phytoactinopolyspora alkaliphila]NED95229.1 hypothetical protein [Phytoactinopolyspora alkaliphila]